MTDFKQFENEGVVFKAKLVGTELVMEPRGDKMCQNSIQRLKAIIKGQKSHKRRVVMKISYAGVKVYDEKTNEILHHHEVPQISFIASDDTDTRTFGYVCDVPSKAHQFICFRTSGPASQLMNVISQLFEAVLEKKKEASGSGSASASAPAPASTSTPTKTNTATTAPSTATPKAQPAQAIDISSDLEQPVSFFSTTQPVAMQAKSPNQSPFSSPIDLVSGDSGIIDSPSSVLSGWYLSSPTVTTTSTSLPKHQNQLLHGIAPPPPPPHLTRQSSMQQPVALASTVPNPNRSLVYNYSSVSLNDAALTRQTSFTRASNNPTFSHNNSLDKYAVFGDIDNFPSIFESTGSINGAGGAGSTKSAHQTNTRVNQSSVPASSDLFLPKNPFDDDFFN